jgi:hypothetical protein
LQKAQAGVRDRPSESAERTLLVPAKSGERLVKGLRVRATAMMVVGVLLVVGAAWVFAAK